MVFDLSNTARDLILKSHTKKTKTIPFPFFPVFIHYLARVSRAWFLQSQLWTPVPSYIYPKPMEKFGPCERKIKIPQKPISIPMIHRHPISSISSLKFCKKPKFCDNPSHVTWKHSRVFLQHEAQRIMMLLPRAGKHPDTSQISNATVFVQRNARESLQFANLSRDPLNIYAHVYFDERGEIPFIWEEVKQISARRTKPEKFRCSFKPQHKNITTFQSWNLQPTHLREPESRLHQRYNKHAFNPSVSRASGNANSLLFINRGDAGISEIKFDRLRYFQWFNDLVCSLINVF